MMVARITAGRGNVLKCQWQQKQLFLHRLTLATLHQRRRNERRLLQMSLGLKLQQREKRKRSANPFWSQFCSRELNYCLTVSETHLSTLVFDSVFNKPFSNGVVFLPN